MANVKIDVEYCGACGYEAKFSEMAQMIKEAVPQVDISGNVGRQGSYEININGQLVYSKLQTMAFPDFMEVTSILSDVSEGKPVRKIAKQ